MQQGGRMIHDVFTPGSELHHYFPPVLIAPGPLDQTFFFKPYQQIRDGTLTELHLAGEVACGPLLVVP